MPPYGFRRKRTPAPRGLLEPGWPAWLLAARFRVAGPRQALRLCSPSPPKRSEGLQSPKGGGRWRQPPLPPPLCESSSGDFHHLPQVPLKPSRAQRLARHLLPTQPEWVWLKKKKKKKTQAASGSAPPEMILKISLPPGPRNLIPGARCVQDEWRQRGNGINNTSMATAYR